jgi:hypothetical protein
MPALYARLVAEALIAERIAVLTSSGTSEPSFRFGKL